MYVEKIKILIKQPTNQLELHSFISEYRNVLKSSYIIGFPSHSDATKNYWKQRKFHVDRKHFITNRNHIKYTSSRLKKTEQLGANTNKIKQNSQHPPSPRELTRVALKPVNVRIGEPHFRSSNNKSLLLCRQRQPCRNAPKSEHREGREGEDVGLTMFFVVKLSWQA